MLANDFLRKIRYSLDLKDKEMIQIFHASGQEIQRAQLNNLLKKEDEQGFFLCSQSLLAAFLDGLIIFYRGSLEKKAKAEKPVKINNNVILRKIRIALAYQDTDMLEVFRLAETTVSKSELSAFLEEAVINITRNVAINSFAISCRVLPFTKKDLSGGKRFP